ncbi:MAG TPA: hypothetical protein VGL20_09405 [Candidatus Dormibacteraeota bacterium]|jgi:hypothetical protein
MELTPMPRRLTRLAAAVAACLGAALASAPTALADSTAPPVVTSVSPLLLVPNGQPFHLTLTGFNLATVNQVFLNPVVVGRSFSAAGDTVLQLTLPADTPAGDYTVRVVSTAGSSDPGSAQLTVGSAIAAAPPAANLPSVPRYSFAPAPRPIYQPESGVVGPASPSSVAPAPSRGPVSPVLLLPLGIVLGGLGYLLWGRPGRLSAAERQGLAAHLIGRPAQALHVGRICLQCGRLHFVLATRRDLWQAGQFCSATCFVAAQDDDSAARAGESTAVTRMREMFVYSELEQSLQAALASEMLELRTGEAPVEEPAEEALVEAAG